MSMFDEEQSPEVKPDRPSLNSDQSEAFAQIVPFLMGQNKTYAMMALLGYAGTGKTFTEVRIVEEVRLQANLMGRHMAIAMSAPTHKAVRVMKKFSSFPPNSVHYATIHSLLGLKAEIDDHGKEKFVESKDPSEVRLEQFDVLILDEVSMLADDLFIPLKKHVKRGLKILFVGDPVQIPPVNHMDSIPLKPASWENHNIGVVELKQIMRQAGENPILRLATTIRMGYKSVPHFLMQTDLQGTLDRRMNGRGIEVFTKDDDEEIEKVIEHFFVSPEFKADPDFMKIISYTNETADYFNRLVRKRIYKPDPNTVLPSIMPGEKLIMNKPLVMETGRILLTTNEEIEVLNSTVDRSKINYYTGERDKITGQWQIIEGQEQFLNYNTQVSYLNEAGKPVTASIRIIHEEDVDKLKVAVDGIASAAKAVAYGNPMKKQLWRHMYGLMRAFAQVKYNYAITAHKSQGSTYSNVLMMDWDIAINKKIEERNRIRYVAVTRARNLLFIQK